MNNELADLIFDPQVNPNFIFDSEKKEYTLHLAISHYVQAEDSEYELAATIDYTGADLKYDFRDNASNAIKTKTGHQLRPITVTIKDSNSALLDATKDLDLFLEDVLSNPEVKATKTIKFKDAKRRNNADAELGE